MGVLAPVKAALESASRFLAEVPDTLVTPREADAPSTLGAPVDEEAFARECLAKLKALTGE